METNTIWTPNTISQWLEERIEFTKLYPESIDFIVLNQNFTYCLKLYNERLCDAESLRLFKDLALKLLFDLLYELNKQEKKCVIIQGITFPTNEKQDFLPQEFWDNQNKWRDALKKIYNQIIETE